MPVAPDPETRDRLRAVADDLREVEGSEAELVAAMVHRVSDLYDPAEDTSVRDIYVNMRQILNVTERGGMDH